MKTDANSSPCRRASWLLLLAVGLVQQARATPDALWQGDGDLAKYLARTGNDANWQKSLSAAIHCSVGCQGGITSLSSPAAREARCQVQRIVRPLHHHYPGTNAK